MKKKRNKVWWRPLDNAAKIFPVASDRSDTKVFRFACQLKEEVRPEALEHAALRTLEEFPIFQSVIKRGFFWYYLEKTSLKPVVREEYREPCSPIFDKNVKRLLFEITYYKNRINLEVHHILTDGTGAIQFLRSLVIYYLQYCYESLQGMDLTTEYDASASEKNDDSFARYYEKIEQPKTEGKKLIPKKAYEVRGQRLSGFRMRIIEGTMSVSALIALAHKYHTTLTVFITAAVIQAIGMEMAVKDKKRPVVIKVPVNLRTYFNSATARNFFGVMQVSYDFSNQPGTFEDIIEYVSACFKNELTREQLSYRMNQMGSLEKNVFIRSTPLTIKDVFMKLGYDINNRRYTFSLSNVGIIRMPKAVEPYIDMFDVFLSTDKQQACAISYGDKFRITFTSPLDETQVQKHFFRFLTGMGIGVYIESNELLEG